MKKSKLLNVSGVFPSLSIKADLGPPRSECGVGALMPWAEKLWAVAYVSHTAKTGIGTGLYEIDENLNMVKRPESCAGTYSNRMIHFESNQMIIGPHVIDAKRKVRTIKNLVDIRLCGTIRHLEDPKNKVYMLGMEGEFYEMDVHTLKTKFLFDLTKELDIKDPIGHVHFKAGYSDFGKVVVANNSYDERDYLGTDIAGRLAEWDGKKWTIIERKPFVDVMGRMTRNYSGIIYAVGFDKASAILKVYTSGDKKWSTYRLPKASHTYDHMWTTEWTRIREVEHQRFMLDCHGMFYELTPYAFENKVWGLRPISTHLWVLGDFCSYRGMFVMGNDSASPSGDHNILTAEPQSGLFFGKTDDLWKFGKPSGWGGPWWEDKVEAGKPSDPYLMTGFDKKVIHMSHDSNDTVTFKVEVDFLGNGSWKTYDSFEVSAKGYKHYEFPQGYSAHWVRITLDKFCTATVYLTYT